MYKFYNFIATHHSFLNVIVHDLTKVLKDIFKNFEEHLLLYNY
jgi:hypothetical protein